MNTNRLGTFPSVLFNKADASTVPEEAQSDGQPAALVEAYLRQAKCEIDSDHELDYRFPALGSLEKLVSEAPDVLRHDDLDELYRYMSNRYRGSHSLGGSFSDRIRLGDGPERRTAAFDGRTGSSSGRPRRRSPPLRNPCR